MWCKAVGPNIVGNHCGVVNPSEPRAETILYYYRPTIVNYHCRGHACIEIIKCKQFSFCIAIINII